ncbi:MAG TPA: BMP family ABC transporter substrate-binding protein [Candidatus Egerieimonas intestinavium]|uniref:BMP family ABC transporter substrate-binding protein n=1 Tax=Candidatus Egerieimonas intestinavium TaxID=2840777 RepID=A0A9D1EKC0_9FIRM|nr:BMP family ABC transporter substrate-binding protein [Candidatus Egerieimonas intestinavium]
MKKKWVKALGVILAGVMAMGSLTACGGGDDKEASGDSAKSEVKIAIICDSAGQNDNGYNQSAVNGAKKAAEELGVEYKVVEPTNGVPQALESLAEDGYNVIFNLEYDFEALIQGTGGAQPIAEMYPDITFVCVNDNPNKDENGEVLHDNVISALFDVHQASYVAGALSVLVNENAETLFGTENYNFTPADNGGRALGFVGGTNSNGITVFSYGFIEGANHVAEELGVNYDYYAKYDAGFADSATGSTVAGTYYNQGANVIFSVAGSVGDGVAAKAKEEGKLMIHVDANKDAQQSGSILTSVLKNTEVPVYEITKAAVEGTIDEMDRVQNYTLASGATSITDMAEISKYIQEGGQEKWEEIKAYLADLESQIGDGTITVTNAQNGEEFDASACGNITIK